MTKQDMVNLLVKHSDLSPSKATHAVDAVIEIVADALVTGEPITVRGFGTIKVVTRAARMARDIKNGTAIKMTPYKRVKFSAYRQFQERIDKYEVR